MAGRLSATCVAWLLACAAVAGSSGPERPAAPIPHPVRSSTRWGTALIAEACRRSAILGEIVRSLNGTKVIVYVQPARHLPPDTDGYLSFTGESGGYRYLRVTLQWRLSRARLIATLAHELQHAREVAQALDVVDQQSFRGLFQRIGDTNRHGYDTAAARLVGLRVSTELERR